MQALELKIPPPALAALIAGTMRAISLATPLIEAPALIRVTAAIVIALSGGIISILGVIAFRCARTTVNPMKPELTSSLVTSGVYGFTRNPMYVGVLFVLIAWAIFLSSVWAFVGPLVFALYINRFQIAPEERLLLAKFGTAYSTYQTKVRKWL